MRMLSDLLERLMVRWGIVRRCAWVRMRRVVPDVREGGGISKVR
jgi:hypothetical protein